MPLNDFTANKVMVQPERPPWGSFTLSKSELENSSLIYVASQCEY